MFPPPQSLPSILRHALLAGFLAASLLLGNFLVTGDGVGYYFLFRQLRARNWSLVSVERLEEYPEHYVYLPAGDAWSVYSQIGASLVWAIIAPPSLLPFTPPSFSARVTEWSRGAPLDFIWHGFAILAVSAAVSYAVIRGTWRWLARETGTSDARAWAAALLAFFGLPTWHYAFQDFSYPHTIELGFLIAALASFSCGMRRSSWRALALSGACVGCASLARMDALLYAAVFAAACLWRFRQPRMLVALCLPVIAVSSFQIAVWWHIFGSPLPSPYMLDKFVVPGVYAYNVLGSGLRGFFIWSPLTLAGIAGLGMGLRRASSRLYAVMGIALLILYAIFYGSWSMWWAGSAVGQRFLIPLFPFMAYGIVQIFEALSRSSRPRRGTVLTALFGAVAFSLMLAFIYPTLFRKGEKESSSHAGLYHFARSEYGFSSPASYPRLFTHAFWFGPRVIHVFFSPPILAGMERVPTILLFSTRGMKCWRTASHYLNFFFIILILSWGFVSGIVTFRGDGVGYYFLFRQLYLHNWTLTVAPESPDVTPHYDFMPAQAGMTVFNQIGMPLWWYALAPAARLVPLPLADATARQFAVADPAILKDGFAVLLLSLFATLGVIAVVARWVTRVTGAPLRTAVLAASVTFFGMPTWHYAFQAPSYPHITELLFLVGALLLFSEAFRKGSIRLFAASGVLIGTAALVRMDAWVYAAAFVCTLAAFKRDKPSWRRAAIAVAVPAVLIGAIQYLVWFKLFGSLLPGSESYSLSSYGMPGRFALHTLFHPVNGLFVWSPIAALGVFGVLRALRKGQKNFVPFLCAILIFFFIIFIGSLKYWWGGIAVGPRYFIPLYPALAYGLTAWYADVQHRRQTARVLMSAAIAVCVWYYMSAALLYPLVSQPGQSPKHILTLWQQGVGRYGAPIPSSYIRMARDTLMINPRVVHLFIPRNQ